MNGEILVRVEAAHFCAGMIFDGELESSRCIRAAPILGYIVGWTRGKTRAWLGGRGYRVRIVKCGPRT